MTNFLYAGIDAKKCEEFMHIVLCDIQRWSGEKSLGKIASSEKLRVHCVSFSNRSCLPFKECDYLIIDTDFGNLDFRQTEKAYEIAEDMKSQLRPDAKLITKRQFFEILKEMCEGGI